MQGTLKLPLLLDGCRLVAAALRQLLRQLLWQLSRSDLPMPGLAFRCLRVPNLRPRRHPPGPSA